MMIDVERILKMEHWRDEVIGYRIDERIRDRILDRLISKHIDEALADGINIHDASLVMVSDKYGKVEDIGYNDPNDLILDNLGFLLAGYFETPANNMNKTITLKDVSNTSRTVYTWAYAGSSPSASPFYSSITGGAGSSFQIGSSSTAASRTDYAIKTAFTTAPENGRVSTGAGSAGGGTVSVTGSLTSGGSGTIRETGLFLRLNVSSTGYEFMICRDVVTDTAFTAGKTITVYYTFTFS